MKSLPLTQGTAALPAGECLALLRRRNVPWWKLGLALQAAREQRLYVPAYPTFDAFVRAEAGISRQRAEQLIASARTREAIREAFPQRCGNQNCNPAPDDAKAPPIAVPTSEKQLRLLNKFRVPDRALIWERACDLAGGRTPSARVVSRAVVAVLCGHTDLARRINEAMRERRDVRLTYQHLDRLRSYLEAYSPPAVLAGRFWRRHRGAGLARVRWAARYFSELQREIEKLTPKK